MDAIADVARSPISPHRCLGCTKPEVAGSRGASRDRFSGRFGFVVSASWWSNSTDDDDDETPHRSHHRGCDHRVVPAVRDGAARLPPSSSVLQRGAAMAKPREPGWLPFSNKEPVNEKEFNKYLGGDGDKEREQPPADTSTGGGARHVPPDTDNDSILLHIEQALGCELIWELADALEEFHKLRRHRDRRGRRRGYKLIDMIIVEIAIFYYGSRLGAVRNLKDQHTWNRLRDAARRAFPKKRFPKRKTRQDKAPVTNRPEPPPGISGTQDVLQRRGARLPAALLPPHSAAGRDQHRTAGSRRRHVDEPRQDPARGRRHDMDARRHQVSPRRAVPPQNRQRPPPRRQRGLPPPLQRTPRPRAGDAFVPRRAGQRTDHPRRTSSWAAN